MNEMLDKTIEAFESKLFAAISEKYAGEPAEVRKVLADRNQLVEAMSARTFADSYLKQSSYPHERLPVLVGFLFDIKLELYFVETDIALLNRNVYLPHQGQEVTNSPRLQLLHLSLDQSLLLKSRIVWERFANFIYFLETGSYLEDKRSGNKTKSKVFKEFIEASPKWKFLLEHADTVSAFDQVFRTPEAHKNSTFRKHFIEGTMPDSDELLAVLNIALNLWQSVAAVVYGGTVTKGSWGIGMDKLKARTAKLP